MGLETFVDSYDVPVELGEETVGGFTHTTRFAITSDGRDIVLKYSSDPDQNVLLEREYEVCEILNTVLHTDVKIPEPVLYVKEGNEILVGFERFDVYTPTEEDWGDIEFCEILNTVLHTDVKNTRTSSLRQGGK
jgi:hypothetical protein